VAQNVLDPDAEPVELRNTTRTALRFSVPGQAIHLLPGQKVSVARGSLKSRELKLLCQDGALTVISSSTAASATPAAAPAAATPAKPFGTSGSIAAKTTGAAPETDDSSLDFDEEEAQPAAPGPRSTPPKKGR
jgi:hypothetical protein